MKLLQQHNKKWWSVRSITSIVVSRLLIMLKSFLTKGFQLHNRIFHEQLRSWHCGGKRRAFRGCCLCFMRHLLIFIELILLQSPLDTQESYWVWNWNGDCFLSQIQRWRRILGWNFPQQIWESRKEKMFHPTHQAALLSHQCPSAPRWMVRIFMVKAHWPSSSSAPPLCPTDSTTAEEFINSWFSPLSPGAKPPRCWWVRGHPEGKAVRVFAMRTRPDWSLLQSQICWADKGILLPENWWNFSKYAKMKYPLFLFDT